MIKKSPCLSLKQGKIKNHCHRINISEMSGSGRLKGRDQIQVEGKKRYAHEFLFHRNHEWKQDVRNPYLRFYGRDGGARRNEGTWRTGRVDGWAVRLPDFGSRQSWIRSQKAGRLKSNKTFLFPCFNSLKTTK
jgi:hypothetical protein